MCRWAAYLGEEVFLEDIVTAPCHSLIAQSHCAREAKSPTNGDGFGIAWYGDRPEPGLYRDILPFIAVYLIALWLITYVPAITLAPLQLWR